MFFDSAVQNNTQNAQDFFESLVNIVGHVRQATCFKCQSKDANFKIDKARKIESVPIELLTLVNFILERIDFSQTSFSKESIALAQAMMFNFYFNTDGKIQSLKKKWNDQLKETPLSLTLL